MHICTVTGLAAGSDCPAAFIVAASFGGNAISVVEVTFHRPTLPCLASAGAVRIADSAMAPRQMLRTVMESSGRNGGEIAPGLGRTPERLA